MNIDINDSPLQGNRTCHCRKLLDSLTLGVVLQDMDGTIVSANPAAQHILGLTLDQMRGVNSIDPRWKATHEDGSPFPGEEHPAMVALRTQKPVLDVVMGVFNPKIEAQTWINIRAFPIIDDTNARLSGVYALFEDITKLTLANKNTQESETRFQSLFSSMSEGVALHRLVYDANGQAIDYTILEVNPAFERQTGMPRETVVGQRASQAYGTGVAPFLDIYTKTVLTHESIKFEKQFLPLQRIFQIKAFAFGPDCFATIFEDITEHKRVDDQLRASQAMLSRTESIAHIGSWEWDIATDTVTWSDELFRIFQRDPSRGAPSFAEHPTLYAQPDLHRLQEAVQIALSQGTPYELELRAIREDGMERICLARGHVGRNANNQVERLFGSLQDITERAQTRTERDHLLKIVEEAPEFISMATLEYKFVFLNKAGLKLVGLPEDINVRTLSSQDIRPPWIMKKIMEDIVPTALRQGCWQGETVLLHRDGHEIPVYQLLFVQHDEFGNPQYLSTVIRDISIQKNYEMELTQEKENAEAANLAKSRFLATMSHEIRTPMNGILGMAQLLLMSEYTEEERREYARTILVSGQTLLTLLNDILDLSKIEAGKLQLDSIVFDPASLLHETCDLFAVAAQAKKLTMEYQWHGTPGCRFKADAYRIRQMLSNLIGNAIKFTKSGSIHIDGMEWEGNHNSVILEFAVRDTGIGIPPEKMNVLFQPFSQTDNSTTRQYGGTGLGLSIVRTLAQRMGGDVGVESTMGDGSIFWFRVRAELVSQNHESRCADRKKYDKAEITAALSNRKILVVEDNVVNCMVIESILDKLGLNATVAHDGQQAVDAIMNGDCHDLILMDIHMPVMDGYLATERIREWEATNNRPRIPIIALTADAYEQDHQHCLQVGMDDFLTKPVVIHDLQTALVRWL
ncbi:PAS domain S-box protein [Candidatus Symbiobacter mobilis]|uniref:Sensory/regulatory protein RpfC n=1 Tax=Candidatus Symbiobacter mobilis CR TaxID=946483 RepID=U5NAI4_9BURK|nr:PAS domain S-box protein [Candidatus Symbiobacter mobilis]AGX88387.1 signal transduction histidine kinase [Candidatus Symbiobacter mobilis CR]